VLGFTDFISVPFQGQKMFIIRGLFGP
jgi:hypothetical protein